MSSELRTMLALHQAGQLDQAEAGYRQILAAQPEQGDALNLLGTLLCQRGQHDTAIPLLQAACRLLPQHVEARLNLAKALRLADRAAEALTMVDEVLALTPDRVDALVLRARCLRRLERSSEARASLVRVLEIAPGTPDAHLNLGDLLQASEPEEAARHYAAVLARNPRHTGALNNLALIHKSAGRLVEARQLLEQALALCPEMHEAYNNLGNVLLEQGDIGAAVTRYEQALAANPDNPVARVHLGNALRLAGRNDEARAMLQACLARWPGHSGAYNNLGILLDSECDRAGAISAFRNALTQSQQEADIWANLAGALLASGERASARQACDKALALNPDSAVARFGLANLQLLEGDWGAGWQNYEFRWQGGHQAGRRVPRPQLPWPQWQGQPIPPGQSLLVFHEQGFGDTLQFMRYLPALCRYFARIAFVCQPSIMRLARASLPGSIEIMDSEEARDIAAHQHFDWQLPLLSVPLALQLKPTIPAPPPTCLFRPASAEQPLQIGLCWAGNPALTADAERSIPLARFDALLSLPGIRWHALVHGAQISDARLSDAMQGVKDFADTAQRIAALDLVISVDTAIAHLAAGMGKPVWLLNRFAPDWRWGWGWQGEHSVWYPSLRQFRQQTQGDWSRPLAEVAQALGAIAVP